ncbi:MAG: antitoxin family protein [Acidobacteriota bacterium]
MTRTMTATFDGEVLRPDEPVDLEPNTNVRITIETSEPEPEKTMSFLDTAASLNLEGPSDWSERFKDYLYGRENDGKE